MRLELVSIPIDTVSLEGLYYVPEAGATAGAVLLFHGNTMNFYTGAMRFLPPALTRVGYACLAFNRRGHDILSTRNSRVAEGGAFQSAREGIEDNRLAAQWLAKRGHAQPGGDRPQQRRRARCSPRRRPSTHAGVGAALHAWRRQGVQRSSRAGTMARDRVEELTAQARAMAAEGRGSELMLMPGWWYAISAESFLDRLTETPDVLELAPKIRCPTLFIRGDKDPREQYPAEEFGSCSGGPCTVDIVANCDHFYNGCEEAVRSLVCGWLTRTLAAQQQYSG